ncbi:hypothetical protein PMZ80_005431 [Knufia obscura]|uniref:Cytochrome P450 monooxygenase n=2 Tax=Knufia TaxID=430999 RepID=A0AAN8ISE3_9EURO|nr:hypothetical protein PMZ80_005431 [Knufia obscura]KAK5958102.1 hypothetical protein OHC33_001292 [Knufia fluminis]
MFGYAVAAASFFLFISRFFVYPVVQYFYDAKGLRKYPNLSPLSGITNIPYMILSTSGRRSERLAQLHQTHPIIRIGPNALSFGDCTAIKVRGLHYSLLSTQLTWSQDIYGHGSKCTKDEMYNVLAGTHFHVADVIDRGDHARKRKMLSSAYAIKNLEGWEHKIAEKISRVVTHFDNCCTDPPRSSRDIGHDDLKVDYRRWTNFFTMEAIVDIGLSEDVGFTKVGNDEITCEEFDGSQRKVPYAKSLHSLLTAQSHIVWSYKFYPYLVKLTNLIPSYRTCWKLGAAYPGIVFHQAKKRFARYQAGEKLDDFFQALMETKTGSIHNLEWGEIIAELAVMSKLKPQSSNGLTHSCTVNAGSVTTATAINNVMYLLLKHPRVLTKLREELDANLGDEDVVPYDKVKHLPYLRACLDEAMRIFPPTPFNLPRFTPAEGTTVMGEFIPGRTSVSMSSYVAHRDTKVFPDPETFLPERWLSEEGKELQPFFLTFSAGSRGCLGRNISYLEQYVMTATMLHRYDFALPSPEWEQYRYEHFNENPGTLPLKVWRRK